MTDQKDQLTFGASQGLDLSAYSVTAIVTRSEFDQMAKASGGRVAQWLREVAVVAANGSAFDQHAQEENNKLRVELATLRAELKRAQDATRGTSAALAPVTLSAAHDRFTSCAACPAWQPNGQHHSLTSLPLGVCARRPETRRIVTDSSSGCWDAPMQEAR